MTIENNPVNLTVAICTYNGAARLPCVLNRLRRQQNVGGISWEVIVIDNNSEDETPELVRRFQRDWTDTPLRYIYEPRQGKTHAVKRAFRSARGALIAFLDDDNVPSEEWVSKAYAFGQSHPQAGAYGGCIYPRYEEEPPENVEAIEVVFAIVRYAERFRYPRGGGFGRMFAPGAGLVVRKQAWQDSVPEDLILSGPRGSSSLGLHEDMEMQWHIYKKGWEIWHNPAMQIEHKIPLERFDEEYLMRFFKELALSRYQYRMLTYARWQRPLMTLAYLASDFAKFIRSVFEYRLTAKRRLAVRCRLQMQKYLLIGPLYHGLSARSGKL